MKTENRLAEALKLMMSEVPLDSISVTTLSKKCHINRQTFYYHFHDIYDLLTFVFLNEEIPGLQNAKTAKAVVGKIFEYYQKNSGFVEATITSAGKELFQEFIFNACYSSIFAFVTNCPDAKKLHANDRKALSRFYALGYSNSIVYYLATHKNKTIEGLLNCFAFESDDDIENKVKYLINLRGIKQ